MIGLKELIRNGGIGPFILREFVSAFNGYGVVGGTTFGNFELLFYKGRLNFVKVIDAPGTDPEISSLIENDVLLVNYRDVVSALERLNEDFFIDLAFVTSDIFTLEIRTMSFQFEERERWVCTSFTFYESGRFENSMEIHQKTANRYIPPEVLIAESLKHE